MNVVINTAFGVDVSTTITHLLHPMLPWKHKAISSIYNDMLPSLHQIIRPYIASAIQLIMMSVTIEYVNFKNFLGIICPKPL